MFKDQIAEQLRKMSEEEKNQWIMNQAILCDENARDDFLKTLTGEKLVSYMPDDREIEEFCQKVKNGDIYIEYETRYYEFDDDGHYVDNWFEDYHDPKGAFVFLDKIFNGCHDLIELEAYEKAAFILDRVCRLEFRVTESEDSEDDCQESLYTVAHAASQGKFSMGRKEIASDWIRAVAKLESATDILAKALVKIFKQPICENTYPDILVKEKIPEQTYFHMASLLKKEIAADELMYEKMFFNSGYSARKRSFEKTLNRKQSILANIFYCCLKLPQKARGIEPLKLEIYFQQLKELFSLLPYTDAKESWETVEIHKICQELLNREKLEEQPWELRQSFFVLLPGQGFSGNHKFEDLQALFLKMCTTSGEFLEYAQVLEKCGYKKQAADLYHKHGRNDKYCQYLEQILSNKSQPYVELIKNYVQSGKWDKACEIAQKGIDNCKRDDQTEFFIILLKDAQKHHNGYKFKELYASVKRRKYVDTSRVEEALADEDVWYGIFLQQNDSAR